MRNLTLCFSVSFALVGPLVATLAEPERLSARVVRIDTSAPRGSQRLGPDNDQDGIPNSQDNCPSDFNPLQEDCDGDGIGDACAIAEGVDTDCNDNGVPDRCDVIYFHSFDCNFNVIPDECESDCDGDGLIDDCDSEPDIDGNGVPDNCDPDCNENGIPDAFEIKNGLVEDCDGNGVPDVCELDGFRLESLIDGPGALTGTSLAIDGDVAVVGTPADEDVVGGGTAHVYRFDGTEWVLEASLMTPGPAEDNAAFGQAVDIMGDRLIVGAGRLHWNGTGSAFVFRFDGAFWYPDAWLTPFGGGQDNRFGTSVAINGSQAVVGAGGYQPGAAVPARMFSYQIESGQWVGRDVAQSPQFPWRQDFGRTIAMDGARVIASAGGDPSFAPRAFGYELGGDGSFNHVATMQSAATPELPMSVAISNEWAAVGNMSSIDVYDSDWAGVQSVPASAGVFGDTLAMSADLLATIHHDSSGSTNLLVMEYDGSWQDAFEYQVDDGSVSVAMGGDVIGVGAPDDPLGHVRLYRDADCNENGLIDYCEIDQDPSLDCIGDGMLDSCGIADGLHDDCNGNGIPDECDVSDPNNDLNGNGIPDDCECLADISSSDICVPDGLVGTDDILAVIGFWDTTALCGDANLDGIVGTDDILTIISNWGPCVGVRSQGGAPASPVLIPSDRGPSKLGRTPASRPQRVGDQ